MRSDRKSPLETCSNVLAMIVLVIRLVARLTNRLLPLFQRLRSMRPISMASGCLPGSDGLRNSYRQPLVVRHCLNNSSLKMREIETLHTDSKRLEDLFV